MDLGFKSYPLVILLALLALVFVWRRLKVYNKGKLPPGPIGVPIFGNLFQLSTTVWLEFEKWKNIHGPLVYINAVGQGILILNTHKVAADLLDRRSSKYSDRPRWIVASDILTGGLMIVLAKQTDVFRRMRRAGHEGLNKAAVQCFNNLQFKEALIMTGNMLRDPSNWDNEFRRTSASTILSVVYDLPTLKSSTDPAITKINDFVARLAYSVFPGSYLVEFFPWMNYLPPSVAEWKRYAQEGYRIYSNLFEGLFHDVEDRINKGDERPSFTGTLIRENERHRLSDSEGAWLSATMYAAGSETTTGVLFWLMLAMVVYPDVQKRCQEELDAVVGRSRMPTFEDRDKLPYICAAVREAVRWRPVLPLGVHHYTTEDDWYNGLFIPKGTICLANIWSLNRDPDVYGPDAEHFNPGRFIDAKGQLTTALADTKDGHVSYGFGPRICLGRHLANSSIFIELACLLWAAKITPTKDATGNPIIPDIHATMNTGMVVRPAPFKCSIEYRFPEAETIFSQTQELNV